MKKEKPKPKKMWALRLDEPLFNIIKRKGRTAAPWVRSALWEALNKQEAK
jgi:hypothetical protein